jgi:hypothetical protein
MHVLAIMVLIGIVAAIFSSRARRRKVAVVQSPRFGVFNLKGEAAGSLVALDTKTLARVLGSPVYGSTAPPVCDVLFLYCDIAIDGRVAKFAGDLRDLIQRSGARVVVVASDNSVDAYIASTKGRTHGRANLVMTIARRDPAFPIFFLRLFEDMKRGTSMPRAWIKLAPQGPAKAHESAPETVFSCELGRLAFS